MSRLEGRPNGESGPEPTIQPTESFPAHPPAATLVADPARTAAAARLLSSAMGSTALDRLVTLSARLLSAPAAQISVLTTAQIVAAGAGLDEGSVGAEGPLEESLCTVTAASGGTLVVDEAGGDDRVADLPPVTSGAVGSYLGVPLVTSDDSVIGALCVYGPEPRSWSRYDVTLLEQLAAAVMAELQLSALSAEYEASRMRWDVAIDAAGIGSFDWDVLTHRLDWDERLQELYGYGAGEFVPHVTEGYRRVHADDRPALEAAVSAAVESCGSFRAEYRIVLPDGRVRWLAARGRALPGPDGTAVRLLGAAYDITEARTARDRAAHLLETMATGFLSVDRNWRVTYLNASGAEVVGHSPADLVGQVLWDVFPGLEDSGFGQQYVRAMETGEAVELEAHYEHLGGWYTVRVVPSSDGLGLYFLDITERHAHQKRAEAAARRMELLATVSAELAATTLSTRAAAARLADIVVPVLADWSVVTLVDEGGLRDIGWAHADARLQPLVEAYARHRLDGMAEQTAVWRARQSGQPVVTLEGAATRELLLMRSPAAKDALKQLAPASSVVVPLLTKGQVMGILSLYRGADRPPFSDDEIFTAGEIADRAALALDNARLYSQQRSLAEGLQRSLLTAPPEPDHCQIVVRYLPAAEVASVGGDWFDSFLQADGATVLVIGDVVGHDAEAAAAMGQVRGLLRGVAWHSGGGPAEILSGVDAAIEGLALNTIVTAVVGRLEQTPDERERGVTRLRWSNAGHPPPMVVCGDGTVVSLGGPADLLLGIDPGTERVESEVTLDREATIVLYTDGLVERRGRNLDEGLAELRDVLVELRTLPLDAMCDELLQRLASDADDDVALLAVKLHRQDLPRPPRAGPERVPPQAASAP